MTPYYLMKCGQTALVPYYRPGDPAVADAIKGLADRLSELEHDLAERTGRKPGGAEVKPLRRRGGPDSAGG